MNLRVFIPALLIVVMAAVVTVAFGYPYIQAKLSILFCGGLILVLALVQLSREFRHKKERVAETELEHKESGQNASALQYGLAMRGQSGLPLW